MPLTPHRTAAWRVLALLLPLASCGAPATSAPPPQLYAGPKSDQVSLLIHGWHTDIAIPARDISGPLRSFTTRFTGLRTLVIGYGKCTFMIAPVHTLDEWLIGPFPGPAALEVSAINTSAARAYGRGHTVTLAITRAGAAALSRFLWRSFTKDKTGQPRYIAQGNFPGSIFYAANARYGLLHTCNTWSAEALAAAGLPIQPAGMILSGPLDRAAHRIAAEPSG